MMRVRIVPAVRLMAAPVSINVLRCWGLSSSLYCERYLISAWFIPMFISMAARLIGIYAIDKMPKLVAPRSRAMKITPRN